MEGLEHAVSCMYLENCHASLEVGFTIQWLISKMY